MLSQRPGGGGKPDHHGCPGGFGQPPGSLAGAHMARIGPVSLAGPDPMPHCRRTTATAVYLHAVLVVDSVSTSDARESV